MKLLWVIAVALQAVAPQPGAEAVKPGTQISGERGQAPVQMKGAIKDADYPIRLGSRGVQGDVKVQYTVGLDGRVTNCRIIESSHAPELDELTCRVIVKRFRFRPAKNSEGEDAVTDMIETHSWKIAGAQPAAE